MFYLKINKNYLKINKNIFSFRKQKEPSALDF